MDNLPPNSLEAEQAVLGAILIEPEYIPDVAEIVKPEDFYIEGHQIIFKCLLEMDNQRVNIDPISLGESLKKVRKFSVVGGAGYLATLLSAVPTASNYAYYARIVKEKSTRRKLIATGQKIMALGFEEQKKVEVLLGNADALYNSLTSEEEVKSDYYTSEELFEKAKTEIPEHFTPIIGMSTGFLDLDLVTGGYKNELILIAARPSIGKTAFVLNSLLRSWRKKPDREGRHIFYSLEQSREVLALRCAAIFFDKQKSVLDMRRGYLDNVERAMIFQVMDSIKPLPCCWFHEKDQTLENFLRKVRGIARKEKIASVTIDHVSQMVHPPLATQKTAEASFIMGACQNLVNEIKAPVIALHQLNRGLESRDDKRPKLSDLRQTGNSEQCADLVLGLYRDEYYNPETTEKPGVLEVNILKARDGMVGSLDLMFNKRTLGMFNMHREGHKDEEFGYEFI